MRIKCNHGYYQFYDFSVNEISRFASLFGLPLVPKDNYYTFEALKDAPDFSLEGSTYLNAPTPFNYSGTPWEIMRANSLVYDFSKDQVVNKSQVLIRADLKNAGFYYVSDGLIVGGSIDQKGKKILSYSAWYSFKYSGFRYSEVELV